MSGRPAARVPARRAFSLVELVVSMSVMSVLAVGVSSAVLVALRSVETTDSQSARIRLAADLSNQLLAEVSSALDVPERTANALTVSVPDRNGDGALEEIRYSWSGVPGEPIYRCYNTEAPASILGNVHCFNLAYDLVPVPIPVTGADLLVAEHHSAGDLSNYRIKSQEWVAQSFRASLPDGVTYWKITRAVIYARQVGDPSGQLTVKLCTTASDGRPGGGVYGQTTISESELRNSHAWYSIGLSYGNYLSRYNTYCLVITGNLGDAGDLRYHNKNASEAGYTFSATSNGGASWAIRANQALLFQIYGVPSGGSSSGTEMRLGSVRWELQAGSDPLARIYAGTPTANLPE